MPALEKRKREEKETNLATTTTTQLPQLSYLEGIVFLNIFNLKIY
jgi:hypothetical protein